VKTDQRESGSKPLQPPLPYGRTAPAIGHFRKRREGAGSGHDARAGKPAFINGNTFSSEGRKVFVKRLPLRAFFVGGKGCTQIFPFLTKRKENNAMKQTKKLLALLLALALALSFAACAAPKTEASSLTDMLGQKVETPATVQSVVSLAPSITEILFALGEGGKVKGVDINSDYPAEAAAIQKVGDFNGPDIEKVAALKPDVVFAANTLQKDAIASLQKLKLNVVSAEATDYDGIFTSVSLISNIMGKGAEGEKLNASVKKAIEDIAAKGAKLAKHPSIYFVISFGDMGNWTSGPGSFINTLMEKCGFTPATADGGDEWMEYPLEQLVSKNPDIIIVSSDVGTADSLKNENGYKDLAAVKEGRVYTVDADIVSRPGVRAGEAMQILYDILEKNQ
jgi:iron complex transport system substrate-binding protein